MARKPKRIAAMAVAQELGQAIEDRDLVRAMAAHAQVVELLQDLAVSQLLRNFEQLEQLLDDGGLTLEGMQKLEPILASIAHRLGWADAPARGGHNA